MRACLKSLVVVLVAFSMAFSPALMGLANAGGIHYEGFSSFRSDGEGSRGVTFNFSFGGPEDYKKNSSLQDVYQKSLTSGETSLLFMGIMAAAFFTLYIIEDDESCVSYYSQATSSLSFSEELPTVPPGYCESGDILAPSDRRLKEDIISVGETHQGLPLYTFRYIGKDRRHLGVMAQDVLKVYPEAVLVGENGYYMVDYGKLGLAHLLLL